jgi:hypothetical protein
VRHLQQNYEIAMIPPAALYFYATQAYGLEIEIRFGLTMSLLNRNRRKYAGWAVSSLVAGSFAFSPILFPALAAKLTGNDIEASKGLLNIYTPAGVDRELAAKFHRLDSGRNAVISKDSLFPFTPVGIDRGVNRIMTIATRIDSPLSANAVSIRNIAKVDAPAIGTSISLNKSDFSLKAGRGWQGFNMALAPRLSVKAPVLDIAAAGGFRLEDNGLAKKSRFKTNVNVAQTREAAPSPRGNAAAGDYKVGLESSFSLSRRIDLTAGLRYTSDRDRIAPAIDDRKDSEAVYVGTKIRF